MGAMKEIFTEAQELFLHSGANFWSEWITVDDHGLMVYAYCGAKDVFQGRTETVPELDIAYTLGGEGVRNSVPIMCGECAHNLARFMNLVPVRNGDWEAEEYPESIAINRHPISRDNSELMECPCGNYLFTFAEDYDLESLYQQGKIDFTLISTWIREKAFAEVGHTARLARELFPLITEDLER